MGDFSTVTRKKLKHLLDVFFFFFATILTSELCFLLLNSIFFFSFKDPHINLLVRDVIPAQVRYSFSSVPYSFIYLNLWNPSPVPELSFLPAPYRDWTRAGEKRVQDNLHAHAQNAAISPLPPSQNREKTIFGRQVFSGFGLVAQFSEWYLQATISAFRLIKTKPINPKSAEFHQCYAKPLSTCFYITISKITK